jgi:hypothetical protein
LKLTLFKEDKEKLDFSSLSRVQESEEEVLSKSPKTMLSKSPKSPMVVPSSSDQQAKETAADSDEYDSDDDVDKRQFAQLTGI